eukprot:352232-Chlamydomonas_euryale.AAC.1
MDYQRCASKLRGWALWRKREGEVNQGLERERGSRVQRGRGGPGFREEEVNQGLERERGSRV